MKFMQSDERVFSVLMVGCALFALLAFARRWWVHRRARVTAPACAACRHPVQDTPSWSCRGCGADLRLVGILTPKLRAVVPAGFIELAAVWTWLIGVLFFGFVSLLPQDASWWVTAWKREHVLHSEAGMFNRLSVVSLVKEHQGNRSDISVTLDVVDLGFGCSALRINFGHELSWKYQDASGKLLGEPRAPTKETVQGWLENGGIACDSPGKLAEVSELFSLVEDIRRDPVSADVVLAQLRSTARRQESWNEPTTLHRTIALAIPGTVWLAGLVLIRLRTRRRRRRQTDRNAEPAS